MKTIRLFILLLGTLALVACSSPQGGAVDEEEYNDNSYNSPTSNVPGRPDGIHTYPSDESRVYPMLPYGNRW